MNSARVPALLLAGAGALLLWMAMLDQEAPEAAVLCLLLFLNGLAVFSDRLRGSSRTADFPRAVLLGMLLTAGCVAVQLIPLPHNVPWGGIEWQAVSARPQATAAALLWLGCCFSIGMVVCHCARRLGRYAWGTAVPLAMVAATEAAIALVQHFSGDADEFGTGTFTDHSHLSLFLSMALPFAVVLAGGAVRAAAIRIVAGFLALVLSAGIVYSFSRVGFASALIALAVILGARFWRRGTRAWVAAGAAAALCAGWMLMPTYLAARFHRLDTMSGLVRDSNVGRWADAARMVADHPVLGVGAGAFAAVFPMYSRHPLKTASPENDYVLIAAEVGLAGCAAVLVLVLAVLRGTPSGPFARHQPHGSLRLACGLSFLAVAMHCMFDGQIEAAANGLAIAWVAGLYIGLGEAPPPKCALE